MWCYGNYAKWHWFMGLHLLASNALLTAVTQQLQLQQTACHDTCADK